MNYQKNLMKQLSTKYIFVWMFGNLILLIAYQFEKITLRCGPCIPNEPCLPCETNFMRNVHWCFVAWSALVFAIYWLRKIRFN